MKAIVVVLLLFLAACANRPTLEQLEDEALLTGDWSAVEARERMQGRLSQSSGPACPDDFTKVCYGPEVNFQCECVSPQDLGFRR